MMRVSFAASMLVLAAGVCMSGCSSGQKGNREVRKQSFGTLPDGRPVDLFVLTNKNGMEAAIMNYGGILVSLKAPDRSGKLDDVVLGFDSLDGYAKAHPYFGALIGRYGNRIGQARFALNGVEYKLARNDGQNSLHGGLKGFDKQLWQAKPFTGGGTEGVELTYVSKDGEEGYPGALTATVAYTLTDNNELKIDYAASTDKDTVLNLTNHSYFNLAGQGEGDILSHEVKIYADRFTPVDAGLIPTAELRAVKGTPFDFSAPTPIGARINQEDEQLKLGKGYDHNFVLSGDAGALKTAAEVYEAKTGRAMEVRTTEPGLQFYTGNFLDGTVHGKQGKVYQRRYGFCMETQHFPDSPNKPSFPSTVLKPGAQYKSQTVYRFYTR